MYIIHNIIVLYESIASYLVSRNVDRGIRSNFKGYRLIDRPLASDPYSHTYPSGVYIYGDAIRALDDNSFPMIIYRNFIVLMLNHTY